MTGATYPQQLAEVRALVGDMPLLVPGIGAQGGDVEAVLRHGQASDASGLLISSSRAILYAGNDDDFANAARAATPCPARRNQPSSPARRESCLTCSSSH